MHINSLTLQNFRNLATKTLKFHPKINYITGKNGAGKTSLIESIYFLSRGKSFRENKINYLLRKDSDFFQIIGNIDRQNQIHIVGIEKTNKNQILRHNGENISSFNKLTKLFPLDIINSDRFALIDQSPEYRRKYLNYGLFYYDNNFISAWQSYQKALKNRNAALKNKWAIEYVSPFHNILEQSANAICQLIQEYLPKLTDKINYFHHQLGKFAPITLEFKKGWSNNQSLAEILNQNYQKDLQTKQTSQGIHRSDLRFYTEQGDVAHWFSRGEQKTLITALILAQNQLIADKIQINPLIFIDDITAELDIDRQKQLLQFLMQGKNQLFISQINGKNIIKTDQNYRHFHIYKGKIRQINR